MATITFGNTSGQRPYGTLQINENIVNVANNTSTISFQLVLHRPSNISSSASKSWSCTIDGQTWSGSGSIGGSGNMLLLTGEKTIAHNNDGSKSISFSASIGLNITWSGSWLGTISGSGSMGLSDIARGADITAFSCSTAYLDGTFTVKYNPKATYTYYLRLSIPNIKQIARISLGTQGTGEKTTTYKFSSTELTTIYTAVTNNSTVPIGAVIECYNGATKITESSEPTINLTLPLSIVPTISSVSVVETVANLATKFGVFVKSQSKLKITAVANGVHGSTIKSYSHSVENAVYTGAQVTTGVLSTAGTVTIKTTVTDTRGRTATKTTNVTIVDWFAPSISAFTVSRANSDGTLSEEGTRAKFTFTYSIAPINNKNDKDIKIQYLNGSTWTTLTTLSAYSANEGTYLSTIDFTVDKGFEFRFIANDYFVRTDGLKKSFGPSCSLINWNQSGRSLSFGAPSTRGENEKAVDFAMPFFDQWGGQVRNGMAYYPTGGADANVTLEEIALCSKNIPYASGFAYVRTMFYGGKTATTPRTQIAYPYATGQIATRQYTNGAWTSWQKYNRYSGDWCTYSIHGSVVKTLGGADSVIVHTWANIQSLFKTTHGITITNKNNLGVLFVNGDGNAHPAHFEGAVWLDNNLYCTWSYGRSGQVRINYTYIVSEKLGD